MKNPETARKHGDAIRGERHQNFGKFGTDHPSFGKRYKNSAQGKENKRQAFNRPEVRKARSERVKGNLNPFSRPEVKHKIKLAAERRRQSGYASPLKGKPWPEARRAAQQKGKAS